MPRIWLIAGSVLLGATATFHLTGLESASAWLDGARGRIVALLWAAAFVNWILVALLWVFAAARPSLALRLPVWISAMFPRRDRPHAAAGRLFQPSRRIHVDRFRAPRRRRRVAIALSA